MDGKARRVLVLKRVEVTPIRQVALGVFGVAELPEGVEVKPLDSLTLDGNTHAALEKLLAKLAEGEGG